MGRRKARKRKVSKRRQQQLGSAQVVQSLYEEKLAPHSESEEYNLSYFVFCQ
jgi:hypothetical protein